ncbi:hypothetical protein [Dictyoglomus thermophilum]|uniref:Uncharacterized protein n=2 Tax=Dictyoglomus thermophilum TaxID=14 RepID=B5YEE1_DICT6|nr:hypothetical protein [Dictyoglomus thermophilum]ACI19753.1 hypothetical protein DICTH_1050 [Dictyoglomus thermophilum H-6-12]TYT22504.1 hypothetical protein FY122_07460 [Dictyoglomus thermophilum]
MKNKIHLYIFIIVLVLGLVLFIMPKYSEVSKKEKLYETKKLELENAIESINALRDTLNKIKEKRNVIFSERNLLFLEEEEVPIFFKDLSIVMKRNKITSFEIKPLEYEEIKDLPEGFPLKLKKLPINLKVVGNYNQFIDFFRDLYDQSYPLSFNQVQLVSDNNILTLNVVFDVYVLERGGE